MTNTQPITDQQLDEIAASVAATFDQFEPAETRQARWEAAALAAGRTVDRNALRVYMAVADAEQRALADDWARSAASVDAEVRRLRAELRIGAPWTCGVCGKENHRDVCLICETDRPDPAPATVPAVVETGE